VSYEKAPIIATLNRIQNGELVLPAIQRDFVWEPERMYKLLDSIFRGYPFSTLLFWNTKQRIQYREFTKEWTQDLRYTFRIKEQGKKGTMVLDGQQRLQTLYLALYGSYEQKILYFDLLSGNEPDDISQAMYHFEYLASFESEERNSTYEGQQCWIPLRDLLNLNYGQIVARSVFYLQKAGIAPETEAGRRLGNNVGLAFGALKGDETLNYFTVDKEFGDDGETTNLDEVLEIFVRVNSGGQVLSKSDLMFSLMQMLWEGAADAISELIERLNRKGRYDFDKDFILKCALVCCGKGAKYEVSKLRDEKTVGLIRENFQGISLALENFMDFVVNNAKLIDDRILRSYNTLIPFVYFYFKQQNQNVRGEETMLRMKQGLYLALMTSLYSRFADNYIDQTTRNILDISFSKNPEEFPLEALTRFIYEKTGFNKFTDGLLQANVMLLMNILEGGRRLPEGRRTRPPEIDHIFPKSKLDSLGIAEDQRNHFANFRLIQPIDNNWKRAQDPDAYFAQNPGALKYYLIPKEYLTYDQYPQFLSNRREKIWEKVNQFFGMKEGADTPVGDFVETYVLPPPASWRQECEQLLSDSDQKHPILQDNSNWVDIFQQMGYSPQWAGRSHWALANVEIKNVSDFAVAVMALNIKPNGRSSGKQAYQFAKSLPDGKRLEVPTREFGGYAWEYALKALENRGLDWKKYFVDQED
jgi:hypothetical protein